MKTYSRVYARIDLDAIAYNMEQMKRNLEPWTKMMAVIKADGYGHGAVQIAEMLESIDFPQELIINASLENLIHELKIHNKYILKQIEE